MCVYLYTYNRHPFMATFQGGTIPKCKIHFLGLPLTCKIGRWTSPRCRFLWGGSSKYLKHVSLHFQTTPKNTLKNVAYILGTSPSLKRWWFICIYECIYIYMPSVVLKHPSSRWRVLSHWSHWSHSHRGGAAKATDLATAHGGVETAGAGRLLFFW